jgi:hypothetical protein
MAQSVVILPEVSFLKVHQGLNLREDAEGFFHRGEGIGGLGDFVNLSIA